MAQSDDIAVDNVCRRSQSRPRRRRDTGRLEAEVVEDVDVGRSGLLEMDSRGRSNGSLNEWFDGKKERGKQRKRGGTMSP